MPWHIIRRGCRLATIDDCAHRTANQAEEHTLDGCLLCDTKGRARRGLRAVEFYLGSTLGDLADVSLLSVFQGQHVRHGRSLHGLAALDGVERRTVRPSACCAMLHAWKSRR